jgi:hypothetical protein
MQPSAYKFCCCNKYTDEVGTCVETVATESLKAAVLEALDINAGDENILICFDGSWQKTTFLNSV